jgi:hypothetical protein
MSLWLVIVAVATIAGIGAASRFGASTQTTDGEDTKSDNRLSNALFLLGGLIELYLRNYLPFHVATPQHSDKLVWTFNLLAIVFVALACFIRQW